MFVCGVDVVLRRATAHANAADPRYFTMPFAELSGDLGNSFPNEFDSFVDAIERESGLHSWLMLSSCSVLPVSEMSQEQ
jgi:hypothetical protein